MCAQSTQQTAITIGQQHSWEQLPAGEIQMQQGGRSSSQITAKVSQSNDIGGVINSNTVDVVVGDKGQGDVDKIMSGMKLNLRHTLRSSNIYNDVTLVGVGVCSKCILGKVQVQSVGCWDNCGW